MKERFFICFLIAVWVSASAQSSGPSGKSSAPDGGGSLGGQGFAIESEMFTYKAVTENSQLIACDVARFLYRSEPEPEPKDRRAPCTINGGAGTAPGIVIVSSTSSLFSDFAVWRADMAAMNSLRQRASKVCVPPGPIAQPKGSKGTAPASKALGVLDFTPAGQLFSLFQGALGLMANNQSVSSVVGTVKDQALMNEVARQLRSLNVQVLMPEMYAPYALGGVDYDKSLYMANLEKLFEALQSCVAAKAEEAKADKVANVKDTPKADDAARTKEELKANGGHKVKEGPNTEKTATADEVTKAEHPAPQRITPIDSVIDAIDSFLKAALPLQPQPSQQGADQNTKPKSASEPFSHLALVFTADGIARQLGFTEDGSAGPSIRWQYILWLKALESGGSVTHEGNIFGSKVRFSGGAVDTYALFAIDGNLVCSGNVYNFEIPVRIKDLQKSFRTASAERMDQPRLVRSTCSMPPPQ